MGGGENKYVLRFNWKALKEYKHKQLEANLQSNLWRLFILDRSSIVVVVVKQVSTNTIGLQFVKNWTKKKVNLKLGH